MQFSFCHRDRCRSRTVGAARSATNLTLLIVTLAAAILNSCLIPARSFAQEPVSKEYQLKAAFLHKFLGFIEWERPDPAGDVDKSDASRHETICIWGENPFGDALSRLVELHKMEFKQVSVQSVQEPKSLSACHLLYVSRSEEDKVDRTLELLRNSPVVTVSDIPGFAEKGGTIEFVVEDQRYIRFIINPSRARTNGIRFSSQLLALAKNVILSAVHGIFQEGIASA